MKPKPRRFTTRLLAYLGHLIAPYVLISPYTLKMFQAQHFFWQIFRALAVNGIDGDYAEFGCYGAGTFATAHEMARLAMFKCNMWGFDSFQGLPESSLPEDQHPRWQKGRFSKSVDEFHAQCKAAGIPRAKYSVVPGFYHETLDTMGPTEAPTNISFAFIDCDLYSSTVSVLNWLEPRLKHGMVIGFDDYFLYSNTQLSGERRAFEELYANHPKWHFAPFVNLNWYGMSFIVEDRSLLPGNAN